MDSHETYLEATATIEVGHPRIQELAARIVAGAPDQREASRRLFDWVRDEIRYNYRVPFSREEDYRATRILERGEGYCVQKALLLATLARAAGIPARLLYADIRNHLAPAAMVRELGENLFVYHSYVEWSIQGDWLQVTPTFDRAVCQTHGYPLVEYDGRGSAIFPSTDDQGRPFIEYVRHHGARADLPFSEIIAAWYVAYGPERVAAFKAAEA